MITRVAKIPKANVGKGFITHADQESDNLRFTIPYQNDTHVYAYVKVDDAFVQKALDWASRNGATILTVQEASAEIQGQLTDRDEVCEYGVTHTYTAQKQWQDIVSQVTSFNS